ncbi:MAG: hypothetical protein Q9217_005492 [Psora testacea]
MATRLIADNQEQQEPLVKPGTWEIMGLFSDNSHCSFFMLCPELRSKIYDRALEPLPGGPLETTASSASPAESTNYLASTSHPELGAEVPDMQAGPSTHSIESASSSAISLNEQAGLSNPPAAIPDIAEMERAPTPAMASLNMIRTRSNHCRRARDNRDTGAEAHASVEELGSSPEASSRLVGTVAETGSLSDAPTTVIFSPHGVVDDNGSAVEDESTAQEGAVIFGEIQRPTKDDGSAPAEVAAEDVAEVEEQSSRHEVLTEDSVGSSASNRRDSERMIKEAIDAMRAEIDWRKDLVTALEKERKKSSRWTRLKQVAREKMHKTRNVFRRHDSQARIQAQVAGYSTPTSCSHTTPRVTDKPAIHAASGRKPVPTPTATMTYLPICGLLIRTRQHKPSNGVEAETARQFSLALSRQSMHRNISTAGIYSNSPSPGVLGSLGSEGRVTLCQGAGNAAARGSEDENRNGRKEKVKQRRLRRAIPFLTTPTSK